MAHYGLTKARSMGPVAEAVERAGGSIARVFRRAELPLQLIDEPERLILLRDQLYLVECAAREIGDEAFTARVATEGGIKFLGALGHRVSIAPSLDAAIVHCNALMTSQLQSATSLTLTISGGEARWTYRVTDPIATGRQKNEILALGYMLDLFRGFLGPGWTPIRADVPGLLADAPPTRMCFAARYPRVMSRRWFSRRICSASKIPVPLWAWRMTKVWCPIRMTFSPASMRSWRSLCWMGARGSIGCAGG